MEKLLTCPYNQSHQMKETRFQRHVVKCANQHPESKLTRCMFNWTHRVLPEDRAKHILECPSATVNVVVLLEKFFELGGSEAILRNYTAGESSIAEQEDFNEELNMEQEETFNRVAEWLSYHKQSPADETDDEPQNDSFEGPKESELTLKFNDKPKSITESVIDDNSELGPRVRKVFKTPIKRQITPSPPFRDAKYFIEKQNKAAKSRLNQKIAESHVSQVLSELSITPSERALSLYQESHCDVAPSESASNVMCNGYTTSDTYSDQNKLNGPAYNNAACNVRSGKSGGAETALSLDDGTSHLSLVRKRVMKRFQPSEISSELSFNNSLATTRRPPKRFQPKSQNDVNGKETFDKGTSTPPTPPWRQPVGLLGPKRDVACQTHTCCDNKL